MEMFSMCRQLDMEISTNPFIIMIANNGSVLCLQLVSVPAVAK